MTCAKKVTQNLLQDCEDAPKKGIDGGKAVLINYDDIDFANSVVAGETIANLVLKSGTIGFSVEWYKDLASGNSALTPSVEDVDGFLHNFLVRLSTSSAASAEIANELKNGRFIMVYETKYKGVDMAEAFKVAGWEGSLKLSEMTTNTEENSGTAMFTLTTEEGDVERYPYSIFLETDYATSKAKFEALFLPLNIPVAIDALFCLDGTLSGSEFIDKTDTFNGRVKPLSGWLDETNYLDVAHDAALFNVQQITYCIKITMPNAAIDFADAVLLTNRITSGTGFNIIMDRLGAQVNGKVRILVDEGAIVIDELRAAALYDGTEKDICVQFDLVNNVSKVFVNGSQAEGDIDISGITDYFNTNGMRIGNANNPTALPLKNSYISEISIVHGLVTESPTTTYAEKWTFCEGENSERVYGLKGHNAVWAGTGIKYKYNVDGSTWALLNGVSLYKNASDNLVRVPFDSSQAAMVTPSVPSGYTLLSNNPYESDFNLADIVIDFDPDDTTPPALDFMDKSDSDIHIATGLMDYYDSGNVYDWTIDELKSVMKMRSYMLNEYKFRLFNKTETIIISDQPFITRVNEIFAYNREMTGAEVSTIIIYGNVVFLQNITTYGAVMDGVTDDTVAINDALAAFEAGEFYAVYIPSGTALIANIGVVGSIGNIKEEIHFLGRGQASKLKRTGAGATAMFSYGYLKNSTVKGILFDNDTIGERSAFGMSRSIGLYLSNVHFRNCFNSLATIYSCDTVKLKDFTLLNLQDNGSGGNHGLDFDLYVYDLPLYINDNIVVVGGNLDNYGWDASKIENTKSFQLKESTCYGRVYCYDDDKRLANCRDVLITGNTFNENKKAGSTNVVSIGTYMRDGAALIQNNVFEIELTVLLKLTDLFYGCSITHDSGADEITITDIIIGNNSGDLATSPLWDIVNILNVGDTFTLPDATGFAALTFEVIELLGVDSLKASIATSPAQITALSGEDVTFTRADNPDIEVTGNTFPDASYISAELYAVGNVHDNTFLN